MRKGKIYVEKLKDNSFGTDCRRKYEIGHTYEVIYDNGYDKSMVTKNVTVVWIHPRGRYAIGYYETPLGKVKLAIY